MKNCQKTVGTAQRIAQAVITLSLALVIQLAFISSAQAQTDVVRKERQFTPVTFSSAPVGYRKFTSLNIVQKAPVSPPKQSQKQDRVTRSKELLKNLFCEGKLVKRITDKTLGAMIMTESSGRDVLIGDKNLQYKAYGPLQIRHVYIVDVNEKYGTNLKAEDCNGDRELSMLVTQAYMNRYGSSCMSQELLARMHNGGPSASKKNSTQYKDTHRYWAKVSKFMKQLNDTTVQSLVASAQ